MCLSPSRKVQSSGGSSLADVPGSSMEKMDPKVLRSAAAASVPGPSRAAL